ncbi:MAG: hypothetical protein BMS9Abin26_1666 [Gammaproteobacteria bacterium]|nr:MAG: hypothetical protein BMS9Abin26_1666 [Gammaproteobacteria bacterium]
MILDKDSQNLIQTHTEGRFEDHLQLLADITEEFATSLDIDDTLRTSIHEIMDALSSEAASIFLLENDNTELVCRASAGAYPITGLRLRASQGIVGKTIELNTTQIVRDVSKDPNFTHAVDEETGFTTRSILCAPLAIKGKKLGAIELVNKKTREGLFDNDDKLLLSALAHSAALALNNASMASALVEQERIQRELQLAREIQRNLLPDEPDANFPVRGKNIPMREVSGDFYDHFVLEDGRICFNLADVSGKGMNAALLMAKTSSLFHCLGKSITEPGKLLALINNEIVENSTYGMFVTMIGGIYDPASGSILLANAGHHPPLFRDNQGDYTEITESSIPVGILADTEYPEVGINLGDGSLYLYTDGLTEIRLPDNSELEVSGIKSIIDEICDLPAVERLEGIIRRVLSTGPVIHDDITLMLIESCRND